jgi:hypothetical protein
VEHFDVFLRAPFQFRGADHVPDFFFIERNAVEVRAAAFQVGLVGVLARQRFVEFQLLFEEFLQRGGIAANARFQRTFHRDRCETKREIRLGFDRPEVSEY